MFRTPSPLVSSAIIGQLERSIESPDSSVTAPDSTITTSIKKSKSIREGCGQSLAKLTQVQARLKQENNGHAKRTELLIKEMEMDKGSVVLKVKVLISQGNK